MDFTPNETVKWCDECGRYYDPKVEHGCIDKKIVENRRFLERWLGRYRIREEGD